MPDTLLFYMIKKNVVDCVVIRIEVYICVIIENLKHIL